MNDEPWPRGDEAYAGGPQTGVRLFFRGCSKPLALSLLLTVLVPASPLRSQIISGTLMVAESRSPISGGVVTLLDGDSVAVARLRTDSVGAFSFSLPGRGSYRLRAEHAGYRAAASPALAIGTLDTLQVEFILAPDVVVLEPLIVTARSRRLTSAARDFYRRSESGTVGTFITRAEIEKAQPFRTSELLTRVPGLRLFPVMGGNLVSVRGSCRPSLYIDGTQVNDYRSIDDVAQPMDVEGIEVYRSTHEAPPQFIGRSAGCAVILIWTRIE